MSWVDIEQEMLRTTQAVAYGAMADTLFHSVARRLRINPRIGLEDSPLLLIATAEALEVRSDAQ